MAIETIRPPVALVAGALVDFVVETFNANTTPQVAGVAMQPNTRPTLAWIYYTGTDGDALTLTLEPTTPPAGQVSAILLLEILATDSANASRFCYPVPLDANGVPYRLILDRTVDAGGGGALANLVWAITTNEDGTR